MKSACDTNTNQDRNPVEDAKQHEAVKDAMDFLSEYLLDVWVKMFKRDMGEAIKQAVKIYVAMMRSKAIFVVKWPGGNYDKDTCKYDPDTMMTSQDGVNTASSGYDVDMIESPAVWKIGNADGENLDSVMVLCKSVVVVKEKEATVVLE